MDIQATALEVDPNEDSIRMIADSAAGVLREDRARARGLRFSNPGFDRAKWAEFAEQGWLMLRLPEERDGLGMGMAELCAIAKAMGRELTPEPVAAASVIAGALPADVIASALEGTDIVLPAFTEPGQPSITVDGEKLSGISGPIAYASGADAFLVETGSGAALVRKDTAGLVLKTHETHDGGHIGRLHFMNCTAEIVAADMKQLAEEACLAHAAYLLGVSESAFDITVQYLKDREQFGKPIGSFQALQHRTVDLFLQLSLLRAAVESAAATLDAGADLTTAQIAVSRAKARANIASHVITHAAIQLHGGIGYTDEADIGLYLRKCISTAGLFGSERFHRDRAFSLGESVA